MTYSTIYQDFVIIHSMQQIIHTYLHCAPLSLFTYLGEIHDRVLCMYIDYNISHILGKRFFLTGSWKDVLYRRSKNGNHISKQHVNSKLRIDVLFSSSAIKKVLSFIYMETSFR